MLLKFIEDRILSNLPNHFVLFIYHIKSIQLTVQIIVPCFFICKTRLLFWFLFILAKETLLWLIPIWKLLLLWLHTTHSISCFTGSSWVYSFIHRILLHLQLIIHFIRILHFPVITHNKLRVRRSMITTSLTALICTAMATTTI